MPEEDDDGLQPLTLMGKVESLRRSVITLTGVIQKVVVQRHRDHIIGAFLVFFVLLSMGTAGYSVYLNYRINSTCTQANAATQATHDALAGLVTIARPPAHETPAEKAQRLEGLARYQEYLRTKFPLRNCG